MGRSSFRTASKSRCAKTASGCSCSAISYRRSYMLPVSFGDVRIFTCATTASTSFRIGGVFSPRISSMRTMSCDMGLSQANCGSLSKAFSRSLLD